MKKCLVMVGITGHHSWSFVRRQKARQKSSSENLSNHNKHFCFQDKTWIKMPKWTIFLISSKVNNSQSKEFVLITEIFCRIFWHIFWRPLFDAVQNSSYWHISHTFPHPNMYKWMWIQNKFCPVVLVTTMHENLELG